MRLSEYPYVVVRIACSKCPRSGQYRLARLAERYGAEIGLVELLNAVAADCPKRKAKSLDVYNICGAFYPDRRDPKPPDMPAGATRLRIVG